MHTLGLPHYPADPHDFGLPERLHGQLRTSAESHFRVSRMYAKLAKIFPGKIIQDERIFDEFIRYYGDLRGNIETMYPDKTEERRIQNILWNVIKFSAHDIVHILPYMWHGDAKTFLSEPLTHIPRIHDALYNLRDVTEGVGVFLSPDSPPLYEFDLQEVLARVFRKTQLRNDNFKYDPTSGFTIEARSASIGKDARKRQEMLTSGVGQRMLDDIRFHNNHYKSDSCESIFDCVEFDVHLGSHPMIVEQGNRGTVFTILYNILKNGYKLIDKFVGYGLELQALYRDYENTKDTNILVRIHELEVKNVENRLFREEVDRRGGKLRLSGEVVDAGEAYVVHLWDNAAGFDLNGIKNWIKKIIETDYAQFLEICADPVLSATLRDGISQWIKNPHASNIVMAHMSEFIKLARFSQAGSSGMGMYGSQVLSHKLGGSVIAAEMATGGAFFSIVVPKDARKWIDTPEKQSPILQREIASRAAAMINLAA